MPSRVSLTALQALARAQHGVVTRAQAHLLGVSVNVQRRLVASGRLRMQLGCLVFPEGVANPDAADAQAVAFRFDGRGVISGPAALRMQGWRIPDRGLIVWCPLPYQPRPGASAVRVLRDDVQRQLRVIDGLTVVGGVDALLDTLVTVERARAAEILDRALQMHWITPETWAEGVAPRLGRGRRGATRLRELGRRLVEGTHSDGERRMARLMKSGGIEGWVANYVVYDASGAIRAELDFAFPELRLFIEVDGLEAHSGGARFDRDRKRQNELVIDGWTVLRFTWYQIVHEPEWVLAQIRAAIALRQAA